MKAFLSSVSVSVVLLAGAAMSAPALLAGPAAAAPTVGPGCGQTITHSTYLHADIGPCASEGLVIGADHVTLDLGGHTVFGATVSNDPAASIGIDLNGHRGVTVRNGTLEGFDTQVQLGLASGTIARAAVIGVRFVNGEFALNGNADDSLFAFNTSDPTGPPAHLEGGDLQITGNRNVVVANSALGRLLSVGGAGNFVAGNRANQLYLSTLNGGRMNVVTANTTQTLGVLGGDPAAKKTTALIASNLLVPPTVPTAFGMGGLFLLGASHVLVVSNRVVAGASLSSKPDIGINVDASPSAPLQAATGNVLVGNFVSGVRDSGIVIEGTATAEPPAPPVVIDAGAVGTVLWHNVTTGNGNNNPAVIPGLNGIENGSTSTVFMGNIADDNTNLGINSVAGVVDLGGDRASGNGNPAQCVNVACSPDVGAKLH